MTVASPGKGPGSLFLFVFGHYSFPLTLFSLRTQGGLHVAKVLSSFFWERGREARACSCYNQFLGKGRATFSLSLAFIPLL
jgi:hypothetical protein